MPGIRKNGPTENVSEAHQKSIPKPSSNLCGTASPQQQATQLSSDTVYPETESDSRGKGLGPTGSPSSQMSPVLPANWLKLEVPTAPSRGSINVIEGLTELGKISLPTIYSDD